MFTGLEEWTRDAWRAPDGSAEFAGFYVTRGFPPWTDVDPQIVFLPDAAVHRYRLMDKPEKRQVRRDNVGFRCVWKMPR
jgi:formylglycine-generating enzyme required for sulfatase activity